MLSREQITILCYNLYIWPADKIAFIYQRLQCLPPLQIIWHQRKATSWQRSGRSWHTPVNFDLWARPSGQRGAAAVVWGKEESVIHSSNSSDLILKFAVLQMFEYEMFAGWTAKFRCVFVPELLLRCAPAVMFRIESVQNLFQGLVRLRWSWSRSREGTLKIPKLHLNTDTRYSVKVQHRRNAASQKQMILNYIKTCLYFHLLPLKPTHPVQV